MTHRANGRIDGITMTKPMKTTLGTMLLLGLAVLRAAGESNESAARMMNAEIAVQAKLEAYTKTNDYELLLDARKFASSMNARQRGGDALLALDEWCLRLQLKTMLAIQSARRSTFDPNAPENIAYQNVSPPDNGGQGVAAGWIQTP